MPLEERALASAAAAEAACAAFLIERLRDALDASALDVSFMISGGSTPTRVLPIVLEAALDWTRIVAFASDERVVPIEHPDSTEGMARRLFAAAGRDVRYLGTGGATDPRRAATALGLSLARAPLPPAVAFLGTAADGHVASLFPDRPEINEPRRGLAVVPETPPHAHPRITHRLSSILTTPAIGLVITGSAKRAAYDQACEVYDPSRSPLSALLRQQQSHVVVFLAP